MAITKSTDANIVQRTNVWAAKEMLKHAAPVTVLDKLALPKPMPKNKGLNVKFRRPVPFAAATSALTEGVTPTATSFEMADVSVTLAQYGHVVTYTDTIEHTHEDPIVQEAVIQSGENIGRTIEALTYSVVKAGTNVFYPGTTTARNQVNDTITLNKQRAVVRSLRANKADKIRKIMSGSPDYGTTPVEAAYVAVTHTDMEADIRSMSGFRPVAEYGTMSKICDEEIGVVENVRYVTSADLEPWEDAGALVGATGMKSTSGTNIDVYPVLFFGKEAFGVVSVRGLGAVEPAIVTPKPSDSDPLAQRGHIGWKTWFAAVRLNELWMARLEVGATDL